MIAWFRFIIAKIYNILRYVIASLHMCNLHIKETEISEKRSKGIKNWKITYFVILNVLSNKTNLILGFTSPLRLNRDQLRKMQLQGLRWESKSRPHESSATLCQLSHEDRCWERVVSSSIFSTHYFNKRNRKHPPPRVPTRYRHKVWKFEIAWKHSPCMLTRVLTSISRSPKLPLVFL